MSQSDTKQFLTARKSSILHAPTGFVPGFFIGKREDRTAPDTWFVRPCTALMFLALGILAKDPVAAATTSTGSALEEVITAEQPGQMYEKRGDVRYRSGAGLETNALVPQPLAFGEALRTLALSGAAMRLSDLAHMRIKELTRLEIQRRSPGSNAPLVTLHRGQLYVISHGRTTTIPFETAQARGVPHGTEFLVAVDPDANETVFTMFDGEVELSSPVDPTPVRVRSGQQGIAAVGERIRVVPILQATNIVQWWIYYPGVLDLKDLALPTASRAKLASSLAAYAQGSLVQALEKFPGYPEPAEPANDSERLYLASVLLAVGAVEKADLQVAQVESHAPCARALRTMLKAVAPDLTKLALSHERKAASAHGRAPETASEWLALSYEYQSTHELEAALAAARASVQRSPDFAFGWARVAELEFSFGNTPDARRAVQRALELGPRNAQAHAVNGFLLASENHLNEAVGEFDEAIRLDPALGNAWLGRGLCKRRLGWYQFPGRRPGNTGEPNWLSDLQAAALAEPHRSLLRSYAGKGQAEAGDAPLAEKELNFARKLDPNDPTPWLYSALLNQQLNRLNAGVEDLEKSVQLNDNRSVYRSKLLLDEDRAVRSASLASIYFQDGMAEVSLSEAARSVNSDYANYSGHLFLANTFDLMRDPTRFNLRYETPWFNELLLANLLAPVGVPAISPNISQQEYTRMFERDRLGLATTTDVRSDGQYREIASQYGSYRWFSYSLDLDWQHNEGVRPNNELTRTEWYSQFKIQPTPQDSFLVLTKYQDYHSGDNFQYFDPEASYSPYFSFDEYQKPIVIGAYHREWAPGIHTLALGGRLVNEQSVSDKDVPLYVFNMSPTGAVTSVRNSDFDVLYGSEFETWIAELNQIFQTERSTLVLGGRYQTGSFNTQNSLTNSTILSAFFLPVQAAFTEEMQRWSVYGYETVEAAPNRLWLTAGLSYDWIQYPENFRQVPLSSGEATADCVGPKAALVWNPAPPVTFRGAYSRSLGGVSFDESFRLEPPQLAGFNQSYRTIIPESVVGSVSAPTFQTIGGAVDLKFNTRTYIELIGQVLESDVDRNLGIYRYPNSAGLAFPSSTAQQLHYDEYSAAVIVNQLVSRDWSVGASYKFTRSQLTQTLSEVPVGVLAEAQRFDQSDLHTFNFYLLFNHPSGLFARGDVSWYWQENRMRNASGAVDLPDDEFPQLNLWVGYRLRRGLGDMSVGLLNATGEDYRLNPLNPYAELPRERVVAARLRLRF